MACSRIQEKYPIHWLVWHNNYSELDSILANTEHDKDLLDPRGRTPLHLAVTLGHLESARILLRHGANAGAENMKYWTVIQEAVTTGDPELLQLCLQYRDYQRYTRRTEGIPGLLQKLKDAPDFYVEMKWEFTSWVPLVSRMCPSDTYRVWKSGSSVRIDTTLLGFDNMTWQRGSRSFVFKGEAEGAQVMEIDHDMRQVYTETMRILPEPPDISFLRPSEDAVAARLTSPIVTTYIDTEKIAFERSKSGIWGWRSDKLETVHDHTCKVFSASNVELVTKTRMEHLTDQDKQKNKKINRHPLESFLGVAEQQEKVQGATASNGILRHKGQQVTEVNTTFNNPCAIKPEDYFNSDLDLEDRDIGRPIDQTTKTQKFKATLWLCEDYPLSLPEQVIPIIDLMASSNAHFKKLKDFITLQLPSGFPIKIEIPLFHVLNARITFGNIFAMDNPVPSVKCVPDSDPVCCIVDETCFEPPSDYSVIGDMRHERLRDEDDELLQFAIQQSLVETGTEDDQVTFWEALNKSKPQKFGNLKSEEERMLQRALEESLRVGEPRVSEVESRVSDNESETSPCQPILDEDEEQLRLVLELSQRELEQDEIRRKQEEEDLQRILELSLTEK